MKPTSALRPSRAICVTTALLSAFSSEPVSAGKVFLRNGDVITAEIKKIWDEDVTVEPEYADEFTIDLDAVSHFESERDFDIEFSDGREVKAKLVGGGDGSQILEIDGTMLEVAVMQIAELYEPEDEFDWDTNIDVNSVINTGNTDSQQGTLQFKTNLKIGDHRHIGQLSFARDEQAGTTTKEQDRAEYSYNWSFSDPWFAALNLSAERDPVRDLNHRIGLGGGIGYDIWDDAGRFFQIQAAFGYSTEEFKIRDPDTNVVIGSDRNESMTAGWILRFNYKLISDLTIFHNHTAGTNVSGRNNSIFRSQTGARYEITDLLYANFQFDFEHETDPVAGNKATDTTTLIGLGLEF